MRALFLLLLIASGSLVGYSAETTRSPLEGAWALVSAKWPQGNYPSDFSGEMLKIFSKGHFAFVGRTTDKAGVQDRFGAGSFTLVGEDYRETITHHRVQEIVGQTIRFRLVITGDTMTVSGPIVGPNEKDPGFRLVEVYRRKG